MKIGLLSDTHSYLHPSVLEHFKDVDEVWHAGDIGTLKLLDELQAFKPTRAVWGNIDGADIRQVVPEHNIFSIDGLKVFITHIGGYPPRYNKISLPIIKAEKPTLFICGHSHILKVMYDDKQQVMHMNPGACGNQGWHKVKTLLKFEINGGVLQHLEVIHI